MRLIDADALKSELIAFYADSAELFNEVSCLVDSAKTAETVPVVLCRDCKFIIDNVPTQKRHERRKNNERQLHL